MISGLFLPEYLAQPLIRVAVQVPELRPEWVSVSFVIDTGASLTAIHAADASLLFGLNPQQLDPSGWAAAAPTRGIAGSHQYMEFPATFAFARDDGEWEILEETVNFGERATGSTPALLGWNVLQHFELTVNRRELKVRLTRV